MTNRREFLLRTTIGGLAGSAGIELTQSADTRSTAHATSAANRKVPNTDLTPSRIAYGTAMLLTDQRSADFIRTTATAMQTALDNGITFFDLADVYGMGQSEAALGGLLKRQSGLRKAITIQSKCGIHIASGWVPGDPVKDDSITIELSHRHILSAAEGTLKRLGTDYLDILLLHGSDPLVRPAEVARAFDDLHSSGKVRYFGVSNHSALQAELLGKYVKQPLVVNQIQLSLAYYGALTTQAGLGSLIDYCQLRELQVQAYSPLKGKDISARPPLLNPAANAAPQVVQAAQSLAAIAESHGASPAAVMLAWLLHHPAGIVPVIGASSPEHIADNCRAIDVKLSDGEWNSLFRAAAGVQPA